MRWSGSGRHFNAGQRRRRRLSPAGRKAAAGGIFHFEKKRKKINNNEEFDPGSGLTLATGLTHASRGAAVTKACLRQPATGARVSNTYATWPSQEDNREKFRLILHNTPQGHPWGVKGSDSGDGWACGALASRRGNCPPRRRCVGVLRVRSPTLELRHGPDSSGRQQ